jgi:hypothetical protein
VKIFGWLEVVKKKEKKITIINIIIETRICCFSKNKLRHQYSIYIKDEGLAGTNYEFFLFLKGTVILLVLIIIINYMIYRG